MKNLPVHTPERALIDLTEAFVPEYVSPQSEIELSIRISAEDVEVRDLSAFLNFVDHIYGRLSARGLRSYARREQGHLKISEMRRGSWELLIVEALTSGNSYTLIVILLAVKYLLPEIESLASAYNQYEQGRLARANRKRLRSALKIEEKLSKLSPQRRGQIAELIDFLYDQEKEELPRVIRFVRRRLLNINIRIRDPNDGS